MGILQQLYQKLQNTFQTGEPSAGAQKDGAYDKMIALGVLLWEVAQADARFLPSEKDAIKNILCQDDSLNEQDLKYVWAAIAEAAVNKIDLYTFAREASRDFTYEERLRLVEYLFRVGCSDGELDHAEHETIRKIARLLHLSHEDFIQTKMAIKKEYGLETIDS